MAQGTYNIGRLLAGGFRRLLSESGFSFKEKKGWFVSQFVVSGPRARVAALTEYVVRLAQA